MRYDSGTRSAIKTQCKEVGCFWSLFVNPLMDKTHILLRWGYSRPFLRLPAVLSSFFCFPFCCSAWLSLPSLSFSYASPYWGESAPFLLPVQSIWEWTWPFLKYVNYVLLSILWSPCLYCRNCACSSAGKALSACEKFLPVFFFVVVVFCFFFAVTENIN